MTLRTGSNTKRGVTGGVLAITAILAGAGAAGACPPGGELESEGSRGVLHEVERTQGAGGPVAAAGSPLVQLLTAAVEAVGGSGGAGVTSSTTVQINDEQGRSITVKAQDGKVVSASVDGKEVPAERLRQERGRVVLLDEEGKEVARVPMELDGGAGGGVGGAGRRAMAVRVLGDKARVEAQRGLEDARRAMGNAQRELENGRGALKERAGAAMSVAEKPAVMMGVSMAEPDAGLARHFGIDAGGATLLTQVYEGLPADKAGLRAFDVVTGVDGNDRADQATIRSVLKGKKAGDTLRLTVLQKGEGRTVTVTLDAFDAGRLAAGREEWTKAHGEDEEALFSAIAPAQGGEGAPLPDGFAWRFSAPAAPTAPTPPTPPSPPGVPGGGGDDDSGRMIGRLRDHLLLLDQNAGELGREAKSKIDRFVKRFEASSDEHDDRMTRLEDRLARLETMLQTLVDRQGGGAAHAAPADGPADRRPRP